MSGGGPRIGVGKGMYVEYAHLIHDEGDIKPFYNAKKLFCTGKCRWIICYANGRRKCR